MSVTRRYFVVLEIISPYTRCTPKGQLGTLVGTVGTFVWSVVCLCTIETRVHGRDQFICLARRRPQDLLTCATRSVADDGSTERYNIKYNLD